MRGAARPARLVLALLPMAIVLVGAQSSFGQTVPPTTEFEDSEGADWTTHEGELEFLEAVDMLSERVQIEVIGETVQGRPLHLVKIGAPAPVSPEQARQRPTLLLVCSQHGNEPAGREACLIQLRDLAFTEDSALVSLLERTTVVVVPSANPDGRAANTRGNGMGTDINRDHLNLETPEARAIAAVLRDWQPDATIDLHEYGPSVPVVYDDDVLYLWPRNLNVDQQLHDLAVELARDHIGGGAEEAGYTADEYGIFAAGDADVTQTAGGGDEGIKRNAGGLRSTLGILTETAVSPRLASPGELIDGAANRRRRVDSNTVILDETLAFMDQRGEEAAAVTAGARERKAEEGRTRTGPVYFDGQDDDSTIDQSGDEAGPEDIVDPPPCGYRLTADQAAETAELLELLDVDSFTVGQDTFVLLAQAGKPFIPLLLDERGSRNTVDGEPLDECPAPPESPPTPTEPPATDVLRVAGDSRVATAVEVSRATRDSAATVVLARSDDYADALAGAPLAVHVDAPLLLSASSGLSQATADEVERLGATEAILLGGDAALSEQVVADLEDLGLSVRRVAGENRFATAAKVPAELPPTDEVVVAEGEHVSPERGWPDALSASGLAAAEQRPVLLVNQARLPEETADVLDRSTDVVIVGGEDAVSPEVADAIDAVAATVTRVSGLTRYDTSVAVADEAEARGVDPSTVWLATGRDWPDGLVAGVAAGSADGILLLVDGRDLDGSPASAQWLRDHAESVSTVRLSGGDDAISPETEARIRQELAGG